MSRSKKKSPPSLGYWDTPAFRIRFAECFAGEAKRDAVHAAILAGASPGKEKLAAKVCMQDPVVLKEVDELCQVARAASILTLSDCLGILAEIATGEAGTTEERTGGKHGDVTITRISARDQIAAVKEYARLAGYDDDEGPMVAVNVAQGGGLTIMLPHNGRDDLAQLGHVTTHALPVEVYGESDSDDMIDVASEDEAG